ncbi:hypothetical protein L5515_007348 [Caenorhabditis briggsae]|uniref:Uncharacterized protein n=1 Tax=Caenorhabditis briggsae TaxID=6238 RepID=A0AAE9F4H2_CAEBR|nr:hypothetical protein L5515_007348 [Caenorhabditis briggsae]
MERITKKECKTIDNRIRVGPFPQGSVDVQNIADETGIHYEKANRRIKKDERSKLPRPPGQKLQQRKKITVGDDFLNFQSHETFLDILLEKIPDADVRGMHYHEVYLAISPMISSVNWARIKFDRRDAMKCYRSLSSILQVCFEQIGLANHGEADQLMLAIYVTSVWCSILKQHPELSQPISDYQDFESYMKNWIFHSHFENFSKVFVASCCQIMESSDQMQSQMQQNQSKMENRNPPRNHELSRSLSLPAAVPETVHNAVPSPSHVHPSWMHGPPQPFMGYMSPGIVFSQFPIPNPPVDPHQNHPMILVHPPAKSKPSRATKRKQKVTEASKPTAPGTKGPSKKGPRPDRGIDA